MSAQRSVLQARETVADGTMAFHFQRPADFTFKAGQAIDLILPGASAPGLDAGNNRHAFSIVSAPYQRELVIATRMRDSPFKRALKALPDGADVEIDGPFGSLVLHKDRTRPAVFIAGGIGITPFMSILRQAAHDRLPQRMLLLYSNRRPQDAAFLQELQNLEKHNVNIRFMATMTATMTATTTATRSDIGTSDRTWSGETGKLDEAMLKKNLAGLMKPVFYVVGPPGMVASMRAELNRIGVDDDDIRSEEFFGY